MPTYTIKQGFFLLLIYCLLTLSLPRAICEHWRACKQSFHQKFFCRYIYRRGSEARKKIQLLTTSRKLEKAFSVERDEREH